MRCLAWGFSSSGVERTFASGGWLKSRREVTVSLANDELRASHFPAEDRDRQLSLHISASMVRTPTTEKTNN